jgi:hypothetical protein
MMTTKKKGCDLMPSETSSLDDRADGPRYRIDKFVVPAEALNDFLKQVERIDAALSALPGCAQHLVLIQESHPGERDVHVLTLVEWASAAHMQSAKAQMQARYEREGFNPAACLQNLGVVADLGVYGPA